MTDNQAPKGPLRSSPGDAPGRVFRRGCSVFAAVLLYGCSTPPPAPPLPASEAPPAVATTAVAAVEGDSAAVSGEQTAPPVDEENNVFFALRSATVDATEKAKLLQHAERLKANRKETLLLVGHSDDLGSRSYNLAITEERLMAVQKMLRDFGVSARQIRRSRSGRLKDSPRCATSACRQQMRRVELLYSR